VLYASIALLPLFLQTLMTGFAILALATWMLGRLTLDIAMWNIVVPNVLAGLALGLIFVR